MKKNKLSYLFFTLSLVFMVVSMPFSGALGEVHLQRDATFNVSSDLNGALKLEGIDNKIYNLDNKFNKIGSITNNTNQILHLATTITPDLSLGLISQLKIRIGNSMVVFNRSGKPSEQVTLTLAPGQVVEIQGSYSKKLVNPAFVSFDFLATNKLGTYTMRIDDTPETPRRIICY